MLQINLFDVGVILVLLAFLARGLMRGLLSEVSGLIGIVGGLAFARHFQPKLQPTLETLFPQGDPAGIAAFVLIFLFFLLCVALCSAALRKFMSITLTSWIDHLLGAIAGLAKGLLLCSVVFYIAQRFFPDIALVRDAMATPFFNSMTDYLRGFLPETFSGIKLPVRL